MAKKAADKIEVANAPRFDWPQTTEKRELLVTLNKQELEQFSRKLAATVPQIANLEREAKSAATSWKARIDVVQCEQNYLSIIVSEGQESRKVECEWVFECSGFDSVTGQHIHHPEKKALVRTDTREVVEVRDITDDERQIALITDEPQDEQA